MGAEREDTDPNPKRVGTEPGLGRPSSGQTAAATPQPEEDNGPPPVDFDALHAALGDPLDYDELPSGPAVEKGSSEPDDLLDSLEAAPGEAHGGDSSGRSSATYASSRPHTIPPTRAPNEDLNAPPVIVATDDTVPSAPPQMTVPLMPGQPPPFRPPVPGGAHGPGSNPAIAPGSNPHISHASSGSHPSAAAFVQTPGPMPVLQPRGMHQMTMRMPDRPVPINPVAVNPRRQKTPTLVVRARGPSMKQKLVAFMAMLLLFTACGIAMIIWRKPRWLGVEPGPGPAASGALAPAMPGSDPSVTAGGTPAPPPVATGASAPTSSAKKLPKPPAPR